MSEGYNESHETPKESGGAAPQPYISGEGLRGVASPQELRAAAANSDPDILNDPNSKFVGSDGQERNYAEDRRYRIEVTLNRPIPNPEPKIINPDELKNAQQRESKPGIFESIGNAMLDHLDNKEREKDVTKAHAKIEKSTGKPAQLALSANGKVSIEPAKGRRLTHKEFEVAVELAKKWDKRLDQPWDVHTEADLPVSGLKQYGLRFNPRTGKWHEYK